MSKKKFNNIPLEDNIIIKDYTINKRISSGGFSFVYLAKNNITNETVAIKEYMPNSMTIRDKGTEVYFKNKKDKDKFTNGLNQFFDEMSIISHIKHNNIINIMDYFELNNTAYIVTPYEYGMPLSSYVSSLKKSEMRIKENDLLKIIIGMLEAIKELHDNNILHLDLKPNNIWLRPNKEILILDFGTSLEKNKVREQHFFTPGFAAPEQYKKYYKALSLGQWTDYYGLGATIFNILTTKIPTDSIKLKEGNEKNDIYKECNGLYHYKILEMVDRLCNINVDDRKRINIDNIIIEIKNIIPFNYVQDSIEFILLNE